MKKKAKKQVKIHMDRWVLISIIAAVVVIVALLLIFIPGKSSEINQNIGGNETNETVPARIPVEHFVEMRASGFTPKTSVIQKGDRVTFINKGSTSVWIVSDDYKTNTDYPSSDIEKCGTVEQANIFDSCEGIESDQTYTFTFNEVGSWGYHDYFRPGIKGTIIVT